VGGVAVGAAGQARGGLGEGAGGGSRLGRWMALF
jgi:hypothetical protein